MVAGTFLQDLSVSDGAWLQAQFKNGLIIVGLGVDEALLAKHLGVSTFRRPEEPKADTAPGAYLMVQAYVLGLPEDVAKLEAANWIEQELDDQGGQVARLVGPVSGSFSRLVGKVGSELELKVMFLNLQRHVAATYQDKLEMQRQLEVWEHEPE